jgi:catechol 2,3-dioxygenase-like lactoylglutathione lyase family enzyme
MKAEHLGIYANDAVELSNWYIDNLGFKVVNKLEKEGRPPIFFLQGSQGGVVLEILPTQLERGNRELSAPGFSHMGLVVDDFEKVELALRQKGILVENVRQTTNGWTIGYFKDPEGNQLELIYRPQV